MLCYVVRGDCFEWLDTGIVPDFLYDWKDSPDEDNYKYSIGDLKRWIGFCKERLSEGEQTVDYAGFLNKNDKIQYVKLEEMIAFCKIQIEAIQDADYYRRWKSKRWLK